MDKILFLGTRDKTDLVMYIAQILSKLEHSILIVDGTQNKRYLKAYTNDSDKGSLTDFYGVDLLANGDDFKSLEKSIKAKNEEISQYDYILYDLEVVNGLKHWGEFTDRVYVGDYDKATIMDDVHLIKNYASYGLNTEFHRLVFEVDCQIDSFYVDEQFLQKIKWTSFEENIPVDERDHLNKINMQFNMKPTFEHLTKDYRRAISKYIVGLLGNHEKEIKLAIRSIERSA